MMRLTWAELRQWPEVKDLAGVELGGVERGRCGVGPGVCGVHPDRIVAAGAPGALVHGDEAARGFFEVLAQEMSSMPVDFPP